MSLVIRSQLLAGTGQLIQGTTTSQIGNLSYLYDEPAVVTAARRAAMRALGSQPEHGVSFRPLNRDLIVDVDASYRGLGMTPALPLRADAVVTKEPGVGLFLLLADCQGVTLYDPVQRVIALAHCGRVSTDLRLAEKTVAYLVSEYGCQPEDLLAYLGPSIATDHYVFDRDLRTGPGQYDQWGRYIKTLPNGHYSVDVRGYNLEQLRLAGLRAKQIEDSAIDTYSSPQFYSHVRSAQDNVPEQRFATYVELRS